MYPTLPAVPVMSSPSSSTLPWSGVSRPDTTLNSVDLPQPEGPTNETNSPGWIASVVGARATLPSNALVAPSMRNLGVPTVIASGSLKGAREGAERQSQPLRPESR